MQPSQTQSIEIVLNGECRQVPAGLSVVTLLQSLGIEADRVAIELNREIVRKPDWAKTGVGPGSAIEIVQFVGGG